MPESRNTVTVLFRVIMIAINANLLKYYLNYSTQAPAEPPDCSTIKISWIRLQRSLLSYQVGMDGTKFWDAVTDQKSFSFK